MTLSLTDLTGGAAAFLALGLIAWLAPTSWAITECRETLHVSAFTAPGTLGQDAPEAAVDLAARAAAGRLTPAETACAARIPPPF